MNPLLMSRPFLAAFLPLAALLLAGCSAALEKKPEEAGLPGVHVAGIVIKNQLAFPITDVMIQSPETGNFAGCGNILPRSQCSTSFQSVDYRRSKLLITWKEYGEARATGEFVIDVPQGLDLGRPAWLEVVVFSMGQAGARLVQ